MNLKEAYKEKISKDIAKELDIKNPNEIPRIEKIVVNIGTGDSSKEKEKVIEIIRQIQKITGQKPVATKAKKAIAGFKIREGLNIGLKITLRGKKMYDFFSKLVNVTFPRVRDFKGIDPKNFDEDGNLNIGIREIITFPEIDYDDIKESFGMNLSIVTSTKDKKMAKTLLEHLGMMFINTQRN